jgi:hypothetical protein
MAQIQLMRIAEDGARPVILHEGEYPDVRAAVEWCAANGVDLSGVNLEGADLSDAVLTGLRASGSNMQRARCHRVKALGPLPLVLSAAQLQGCQWDDAELVVVHLDCTHPTSFARVKTGDHTVMGGCDWIDCPDVIPLVIDDVAGAVISHYDGERWKVYAGSDRGVIVEADAKIVLEGDADARKAERYRDAFAVLDASAERKREIEQRERAAAEDGAAREEFSSAIVR